MNYVRIIVLSLSSAWLLALAAHVFGASIYDFLFARHKRDWNQTSKRPKVYVIRTSGRSDKNELKLTVNNILSSQHSEKYVLFLNQQDRLDKNALEKTVNYIEAHPKLDAVGLNIITEPHQRIASLFEAFNQTIQQMHYKYLSLIKRRRGLNQAVLYRKSSLAKKIDGLDWNDRFSYQIVSDALIRSPSPRSLRVTIKNFYDGQLAKSPYLSFYAMALKFILPAFFTYLIFESAYLRNTYLLGLSWAAFSIYVLLAIISDSTLKISQKFALCLLAPATFLPLIILSFLMATASFELFITSIFKYFVHFIKKIESKISTILGFKRA